MIQSPPGWAQLPAAVYLQACQAGQSGAQICVHRGELARLINVQVLQSAEPIQSIEMVARIGLRQDAARVYILVSVRGLALISNLWKLKLVCLFTPSTFVYV